jgi:serine/threonine-protein kinase RsbW
MQEFFVREMSALAAVFAALDEFARRHDIGDRVRGDLGVIVEELFTNQVRHARSGKEDIRIRFTLRDEVVEIELRDRDVEPFDPTAAPQVDTSRPAAERQPGGLGIHLVRSLSDTFEWDYDDRRRESRIRVTRRLTR